MTNKELYIGLKAIAGDIGWRGNGRYDTDIFYCEHCGESGVESSDIRHAPVCIVTRLHTIIKELEG